MPYSHRFSLIDLQPLGKSLRDILILTDKLEWNLEVITSVVVVGDSNLARIPSFENADIQVDSFPRSACHHLHESLKKFKPVKEVREVVLSVGLNNSLLLATTDKQLVLLVNMAKQTFPNAKIRVPVINYSDRLDADQKHLLESINNTIIKKYDFLNDINKLHFQVTQDNVHWTPSTAKMIFEAWTDQLNL